MLSSKDGYMGEKPIWATEYLILRIILAKGMTWEGRNGKEFLLLYE